MSIRRGENVIAGIPIIDQTLSTTSERPVQNKVVTTAINNLSDTVSSLVGGQDLVHISGTETITGNKTFSGTSTFSGTLNYKTSINETTNPQSAIVKDIQITDVNGTMDNGRFGIRQETNGNIATEMVTQRNISNTLNKSFLTNVLTPDGKAYLQFSPDNATNLSQTSVTNSTTEVKIPTMGWVNNPDTSTNVVHRSGDENIAGDKTFTNHNIKIKSKTQYNQSPSSQEFTSVYFNDGTTIWGAAEGVKNTNGSNCVQFNVYGKTGTWASSIKSALGIGVTTSGTTFTYAPTPDTGSNDNNIATTSFVNTAIANILDALYPVGSLYLGTQSTCPLITLIPGSSWTLVSAGKALWTGNGTGDTNASTPNGTTTNANYASATANTTIAAGVPNITGSFGFSGEYRNPGFSTADGAFVAGDSAYGRDSDGGGGNRTKTVNFDASQNGTDTIYGKSTTVQPPANVTNVWRRTA